MNLREKRTNFLKDCYQIYKNNPCPKEEFTNIIYNLLKCYNNVISEDIEYYFPYWINRSKEHYKTTTVFQDENWKYFCQFTNEEYDSQTIIESDPIKLYVPLKKEYIYAGVNRIFKFCDQNDIIHKSKVSKEIRTDNVILRIKEKEDAIKVINFINNDRYLKEGSLTPNPFLIQDGNIGIAIDNYNSYNFEVATWISKYITTLASYNSNKFISDGHFKDFIEKNPINYNDKDEQIFKDEIKLLIIKAMSSNDINILFDHYDEVSNNFYKNYNHR